MPRFQKGDQVRYMGSQLRVQGWQFEVTRVQAHPGGEPRYSLHNPADKLRLHNVRENSLQGPDDDPPEVTTL